MLVSVSPERSLILDDGAGVDLETDWSRVDGDRVQFYVGLSLTEEGQTLLEK